MSLDLSAVPTCELVDELKKREGVWTTSVEPDAWYSIVTEDIEWDAEGPVEILVVCD